jgi:hypothetical protein
MRVDSPSLVIIAGGRAAQAHREELAAAGCTLVCTTIWEGRRAIRNYMARKPRFTSRQKYSSVLAEAPQTSDRS